jgi:arogenate dehydrogenase (NADP+), plant
MYPKQLMMSKLPPNCDICCTHPMFGPSSATRGVHDLAFMFERVRISDESRCRQFLDIWKHALKCKMVEMTCEEHDQRAANSQFVTHIVGRMLGDFGVESGAIDTPSFGGLLSLAENMCSNSDDLFCGLYAYNPFAVDVLRRLKVSLTNVEERLLASKSDNSYRPCPEVPFLG